MDVNKVMKEMDRYGTRNMINLIGHEVLEIVLYIRAINELIKSYSNAFSDNYLDKAIYILDKIDSAILECMYGDDVLFVIMLDKDNERMRNLQLSSDISYIVIQYDLDIAVTKFSEYITGLGKEVEYCIGFIKTTHAKSLPEGMESALLELDNGINKYFDTVNCLIDNVLLRRIKKDMNDGLTDL